MTGAVIPYARVQLSQGTKLSKATLADQQGEFEFVVAPGDYTITVRADGFVTRTLTAHVADEAARLQPIKLEVGRSFSGPDMAVQPPAEPTLGDDFQLLLPEFPVESLVPFSRRRPRRHDFISRTKRLPHLSS